MEVACGVIRSGVYVNGPENEALTLDLSNTLGLQNVVPVSNGLDAIRLIIRGYMEMGRLQKGDEIILPANTYIASVLPLVEFGLIPILTKPDLATFGLDWEEARKMVTSKTRALMTVHLYGTPSWNFEIADNLRSHGILLLEDNAQAIGAAIRRPDTGEYFFTGSLGDASAFSFYPTKNIGALGDAGAVATLDAGLADMVRALANYGSVRRYDNRYTGYNCRMDEIQAAFIRVKLKRLKEITVSRNKAASYYNQRITNPEVTLPTFHSDMVQVWHQYVILHPRRDALRKYLTEEGVAVDIHYPISLFDQKCFAPEGLPDPGNVKAFSRLLAYEVLSLPVANVSATDIDFIADSINSFS